MNQFFLQHGRSKELNPFTHILELGIRKNTSIQLDSFSATTTESIRIYYIMDGKFEWVIKDQHHILYPGDLAIVLPGQTFRGERDFMDIGSYFWINMQIEYMDAQGKMRLGHWSGLSESECLTIGKILLFNNTAVLLKIKEASPILHGIQSELINQEIGYTTRVNQLIDELMITIARQSTRQTNSRRDFPQTFMKLEQALRQNLSHQWTVDEMAALVGLGTTAFTEKVKNYTGFSPLNYLINIRISEAIKLLKKPDINVTDIALDTGFYSSQHFSTTFKKLTGYTPGEFRKKK
ncbi:MAG TPA: AraC family transcriptional regulator [Ohtaekwangia sp.]